MFTNVDSWRELLADKPIHYTKSQLLQLREKQKASWRKHCNELFESKTFKDSWSFEGSDQYKVATFEPHHKKEVLDIVMYQFSSSGNNTFQKILNTPVGALKWGCVDSIDHICKTGLSYVLLDRYNHVQGVFYGWDIRDEPVWYHADRHHPSSIKEDEIIKAANLQHPFSRHLFEQNKDRVPFGTAFYGEILCVSPTLMSNAWFAKLSFIIALVFGMDYDVYFDYDFQPTRHLYEAGVFESIEFLKTSFVRYDLFYFGDFKFECDGTNIADHYPLLRQNGFTDVDNLRRNAYVGCFILRNSKGIRDFFDNDFIKCYTGVQMIRTTQDKMRMQIKQNREKKRKQRQKIKSKL